MILLSNKHKAIILMLLSSLSFAIMSSMVKLAGDIPGIEKVFFRNLFSFLITIGLIRGNKNHIFGKKGNRPFLILRSLLGLMGVVSYFFAINNLPLADSAMLNKLSPFFVLVFAGIFLSEKITRFQIISIFIAFFGALLIIKPKFDITILPALSGLFSAVFAGGAYTTVRYLGNKKEHPSTIIAYFSFISLIGTLPFTLINFVIPTFAQFSALIGIGIFAAGGQFGLTFAYKYTKASEISIYNYTNIVFSGIIGYLIWKEIPDIWSICGIIIILAISIINFSYQNKEK